MRRVIYLLSILALMATGCASDGVERTEPERPDAPMGVDATPQAVNWQQRGSRADDPGEIAYPVAVAWPETMGVFGFAEQATEMIFNNQLMYYHYGTEVLSSGIDLDAWDEMTQDDQGVPNAWPYAPEKPWPRSMKQKKFKFYAYAPYVDNSRIIDVFLSYENFAGLTITDIRPADNHEQLLAATLWWHDAWSKQPRFTLRHLCSRLRLCFSVSEKYDDMRDIRLKRVEVTDLNGSSYFRCNLTVDTETGAMSSVYTPTGLYDNPNDLKIELLPEYDSATFPDGMTLHYADGYRPYGSLYVVPHELSAIVVTVTYDVYDEQGLLTRENCQATNAVPLDGIDGGLQGGYCYDLRVMVSPRYLYVLSDNDVAPDGLIEI